MSKEIYSKDHKKIIERLKKARQESMLDQVDVAKTLNRTQSYVSKIESGQRRIDVLVLKRFAEVYNKPIEYFLE